MKLHIYTDGGARNNPGPAGIGYEIYKPDQDSPIASGCAYIGEATNNTAEYQGVIHSLNRLQELNPPPNTSVVFFLDSQLVVNQLGGTYKIKQPHLKKLADEVHQLISQLKLQVAFIYIPRVQNHRADALVNQALDQKQSSSK